MLWDPNFPLGKDGNNTYFDNPRPRSLCGWHALKGL
jgi:hypothetical protein